MREVGEEMTKIDRMIINLCMIYNSGEATKETKPLLGETIDLLKNIFDRADRDTTREIAEREIMDILWKVLEEKT